MSNTNLLQHPPFARVTSGEETAIDRQWLRLLEVMFEDIPFDALVDRLPSNAHELLGIIALRRRFDEGTDNAA